jgi:preprotein translocase subunit SecE
MNPIKSLTTYLRASKAELEKVSWPTKEETLRYSGLVVVVCFVTAGFFASLDFGFSRGLDLLISVARPDIEGAAPTNVPPVTPEVQPFGAGSGIEAVDEFGNPTPVDVETLPLNDTQSGTFTISPEEEGSPTEE